ncbi:MFS transporter [Streptomyces griseiscabiei]|uniref:MFS transporter n=1 Tax=Streptomyces griseiscabiei TaxID=2993540 RepID=A0ABU4L4S4_9ACTN|nr:MFS transporter [Streptomyces griseiscabiei]MBZ3905391.1 MFS transporter [Streptomyces griseiscabiei]MDX2910480.1 MFS transporter [Streptomyces griseiscabiei]
MPHQPLIPATPARADRSPGPYKIAVLGGLASYLDAATIVSTAVSLVLFQFAFGLTPLTIGILSGLLTVTIAIGAAIGGRLGDLVGRKRVYTLDLLVFTAGVAVLFSAVNTPMLYVGVIVAGLAMGADLPTSLALIAENSPDGLKGRMVSVTSLLWLGGVVVVSLLAGVVAPYGVTGARILYAHVLVVAIVTWFLRRSLHESTEWQAARTPGKAGALGDERSMRALLHPRLLVPLLVTALYCAFWSFTANTVGAFLGFLYVNVAHVSLSQASLLGLVSVPFTLVSAFVFLKVADSRARRALFVFGSVVQIVACAAPLVMGFTSVSLFLLGTGFGIGGAFAGEGIYRVWSQEFFPTLLRGTAQGITSGISRGLCAGFAVITPTIAVSNPRLLIGLLVVFLVVSGLIGALAVPALERSRRTAPWDREPAGNDTIVADPVGVPGTA